jgi:uncharacterized protein involved in response to NO
MPLKIEERDAGPVRRIAIWQLGFRPFFLLSGFAALFLIGTWLSIYTGKLANSYFVSPSVWHSHEMFFGYAVAVIAGFLLTAVQNWTGIKTVTHLPLMLLVLVWLMGRFMIAFAGLFPDMLVLLVDLSFLPLLAIAVALPLFRARQYRNLFIIGLLLLMAVANYLVHVSREVPQAFEGSAIQFMYFLIMLIIAIMAGRVVPFFTERGIGGISLKTSPWLDRLAILSIAGYALVELFRLNSAVSVLLAVIAGIANGVRLLTWYHPGIWRLPMLWVLHLAYAWLVLSLLLGTLTGLHWFSRVVEVHAFTVGGVGMMTLGMMTRVSQGHTGRDIRASRLTTLAFHVLLFAAIIRVAGGIFMTEYYVYSIVLSATFWLVAFGLFVIEYMPLLLKPRVDGRPG